MSQGAVFVRVNNILYHEIFPSVPDEEALISMCVDLDCEEDAEIEYEWYEIGDGEYGTDDLFNEPLSEEILLYWYNSGELEKQLKKYGYDLKLVESGGHTINEKDMESYWL